MSNIDNVGPAFQVCDEALIRNSQGMTLRDYFAASALPAVYSDYCNVARTVGFDEDWKIGVALDAFAMADAMLAAREKGGAS